MQIEEEEDDIYHNRVELQVAIRRLSQMENGGRAVEFLQHLIAKGLEPNGVLKYADSMSRVLQELDLENSTKKEIESFIAKINTSKLKPTTKRNYRLTVKKLSQWLKYGDTSRNIQHPAEVAWIRPHPSQKEIDESSRVGPDKLLGPSIK